MEKINALAKKLAEQGYKVECFENSEAAVTYLDSQLDNETIGIGGSQTVKQMKLYPVLAAHNKVYWHDEMPDNMTVMEVRQAAFRAPVYISSVNAIALDGTIVNIDATGNRVAAISFGPRDIYLLVGRNKITKDYDSAIYRARNIAAPLNAQRLNRKTPCAAKADRCYDCKSPERICRNFCVFRERPYGATYHVILINEDLGY
ncbi:MAG: lactate utilization protein [Lachnospiraceae bacterium]|nr:lactate utilization protein [Lachnospiraceae bacterium]